MPPQVSAAIVLPKWPLCCATRATISHPYQLYHYFLALLRRKILTPYQNLLFPIHPLIGMFIFATTSLPENKLVVKPTLEFLHLRILLSRFSPTLYLVCILTFFSLLPLQIYLCINVGLGEGLIMWYSGRIWSQDLVLKSVTHWNFLSYCQKCSHAIPISSSSHSVSHYLRGLCGHKYKHRRCHPHEPTVAPLCTTSSSTT